MLEGGQMTFSDLPQKPPQRKSKPAKMPLDALGRPTRAALVPMRFDVPDRPLAEKLRPLTGDEIPF